VGIVAKNENGVISGKVIVGRHGCV